MTKKPKRPNALKYGEPTKPISIKVPVSRIPEAKKVIYEALEIFKKHMEPKLLAKKSKESLLETKMSILLRNPSRNEDDNIWFNMAIEHIEKAIKFLDHI